MAMNMEDELEETKIEGFDAQSRLYFAKMSSVVCLYRYFSDVPFGLVSLFDKP